MRFSCKCTQGLCVGMLTLEPPAEATVGISEGFIAAASSQFCSLGTSSVACLGVWLLGFPCQAAAAWGSGVAEPLEQDLCYLQAHAVH